MINSQTPYRSRLGLKLAALFVAAVLAILVGGLVLDVFAGFADGQKSREEMAIQQPAIVIDPKLESELAKVINFENAQNMADLRDPFQDRSGLGSTEAGRAAAAAQNTRSGTNSPAPNTTNTAGAKAPKLENRPGGTPATNPGTTVETVKEDTSVRLARRDEDIRNGKPVRPINEYLAIEDLLPVGAVSGGSGQDEIMLYSQAADQTFSFALGTQFFDGSLYGLRPEGPVFSVVGLNQAVTKSWVRSIQPRSSTDIAVVNPQVKP